MIQINEEALAEYDRKRYEELVAIATNIRGLRFYSEMLARKVDMHLMHDVLIAAVTAKVVDLDWTVARNVWGNLMRHPRMMAERRAMFIWLYDLKLHGGKKYSLPEIAAAFGTGHTSIRTTIYKIQKKPKKKAARKKVKYGNKKQAHRRGDHGVGSTDSNGGGRNPRGVQVPSTPTHRQRPTQQVQVPNR